MHTRASQRVFVALLGTISVAVGLQYTNYCNLCFKKLGVTFMRRYSNYMFKLKALILRKLYFDSFSLEWQST